MIASDLATPSRMEAYNQKLVKKIAVRGITVKGLAGTDA